MYIIAFIITQSKKNTNMNNFFKLGRIIWDESNSPGFYNFWVYGSSRNSPFFGLILQSCIREGKK